MGIGTSVFLLAVGGILGFAVDDRVQGVNTHMVGYILMAAGLLGLFMTTVLLGRRSSAVVTQEHVVTDRAY